MDPWESHKYGKYSKDFVCKAKMRVNKIHRYHKLELPDKIVLRAKNNHGNKKQTWPLASSKYCNFRKSHKGFAIKAKMLSTIENVGREKNNIERNGATRSKVRDKRETEEIVTSPLWLK